MIDMGSTDAGAIKVAFDGEQVELMPGQAVVFGRDKTCDARFDPTDLGVSRVAGKVSYDDGRWCVRNLSRKRALHIVESSGFAIPLPVAIADGPASRWTVEFPGATVLVVGELWTYALVLTLRVSENESSLPRRALDPMSTRTQQPRLTEKRREVLVAMTRGYLRAYPHYDPRPKTYQEVADLLGLSRSQVVKRVESVRADLVAAGVPGLENEGDARRALCEWLLVTRVIGPSDLAWLQPRLDAAAVARRGDPDARS